MSFQYHKYKIIISIDLGTASSGTCCSVLLDNEQYTDIIHIANWPQQLNNEIKTPAVCVYDEDSKLLYWGKTATEYIESGDLKVDEIVKERFKSNLSEFVPRKKATYETKNTKKTPLDNMTATADYFREILSHTFSVIKKDIRIPKKISIEKEDTLFVITVPDHWKQLQKTIMRTIVKEAGMITNYDQKSRLLIINESLATSMHCEMMQIGYSDMEPGDKYIVCDAGGCTVDLATFESVKNFPEDPKGSHKRCQLTTDSSNRCGSTFIDQRMRELLTQLCYNGVPPKDKDEEKIREKLFSPAVDKFIKESKIVFGQRSKNFKFPPCGHHKFLKGLRELDDLLGTKYEKRAKMYASELPVEASGEGDPNDGQCLACKAEDFKYLFEEDFGKPTIVILEDAIVVPSLKYYLAPGLTYDVVGGTCTFSIPYDVMRKFVFHDVVKTTIDLIDRQIKKANLGIDRTYLVGGFGGSPYLRKMILRYFHRKASEFPKNKFLCGKLVTDVYGDVAAMRGAIIHGIEYNSRKPKKEILGEKFECRTKYSTLICLDIGYETTSCSYKDLETRSSKTIDIVDWPGLKKFGPLIPTAKEFINGKTFWGAEVDQLNNFDYDTLVFPSKLLASVKPTFRSYLCDYLNLVLDHVYKTISRDNIQLSDKNRYRYVITMENCYPFFHTKSEMRRVAIQAGIITKEDSVERLLLINRDIASAMYNENKHFSKKLDYTFHFLQVNVYHDTCYLSLFEATKIHDPRFDTKIDKTGVFRYVRCKKSVTFDFDFIRRAVSNLEKYLTANYLVECDSGHIKTGPTYYSDLRKGLIECINSDLDLPDNDKIQFIRITETGCCIAPIKVYNLLEYVFLPAIRDLVLEIDRFANQADMVQYIKLSKIFLSGSLINANEASTRFLNRIFVRNISKAMRIPLKYFELSRDNGKEALLGALLYENNPASFTERVARTTYAVNVRAFKLKAPSAKARFEMEKEIKREIEKGNKDEKRRIYHAESMYGVADLKKPVSLRYQSPHNPSFYDETYDRLSDELSFFINRGDKIYEKDQKSGIFKKFYAQEACIIAYITIYSSDSNEVYKDKDKINDEFREIHQFEVYLRPDEDDPMFNPDDIRLSFDVIYTPEDHEAKFEVKIGSRFGKTQDFYCKEDFLVANIYGDEQRIRIEDLTIDPGKLGQNTIQKM